MFLISQREEKRKSDTREKKGKEDKEVPLSDLYSSFINQKMKKFIKENFKGQHLV